MNEKRKREYWQMFIEVWRLFKFFLDNGGSDAAMERFVAISRNVYRKYEHLDLAQKMILAVIGEVSRINREESTDGQGEEERTSNGA